MKKLVLKYLPIPVALILAVLCSLTLSSYNKNGSEYAIVSYEANAVALDLTVSQTGMVVKIVPPSLEIQESMNELDLDIKGKHISDALKVLSELADENETVFVSAYINEEEDIDAEEMKALVKTAVSKLECAYFSAYGTYESYDLQRAITYKKTIGKVTYVKFFADTVYDEIALYIDSYRLYDINAYDLGAYFEYICEKNEFEDKNTLFRCDASNIAEESDRLSMEDSQALALAHIRNVYEDDPEAFSYSGYSIDYGYLAHAFDFRYNGENREIHVNTKTGESMENFLDDY